MEVSVISVLQTPSRDPVPSLAIVLAVTTQQETEIPWLAPHAPLVLIVSMAFTVPLHNRVPQTRFRRLLPARALHVLVRTYRPPAPLYANALQARDLHLEDHQVVAHRANQAHTTWVTRPDV